MDRGGGLLFSMWRRFRRDRFALAGLTVLVVVGVLSIAAPALTRYAPDQIDLKNRYLPPGRVHGFGTDGLGRDVLSRILHAGRVSLAIGVASAVVAALVGTMVGATAGYYTGWTDLTLMRFTDLVLSIPPLPLIIVLSVIIRPSVPILILLIALRGWMGTSRMVRGVFIALLQEEYVTAARACGCSNGRILFRHILPNSLAPVIVAATLAVGSAIITESVLSFLGVGVRPPTASWGNMLQDAQSTMATRPWLSIFPGVFIMITVLSVNALGDGLRDSFDVRVR
jgi:peptide/nickel transport system permease protein